MVEFRFHLKMPIFVMRQWVRHRTANLNEYSGRYSVMSDEFYIPELDRIQPQSIINNQGSSGKLSEKEAQFSQSIMRDLFSNALDSYKLLLNEYSVSKIESDVHYSGDPQERQGVSRELARVVLPVAGYTELYWKIDLKNLLNLLKLRMDSHAQWEIQQFAQAMYDLIKPIVPISCEAFEDYINQGTNISRMEKNFILELLGADMNAKAALNNLLDIHGSEENLMKYFELSTREWAEIKKKLLLG